MNKNDLVGKIENSIRNCFVDRNTTNLTDDIAAAGDVLDVERGVNTDAAIEQFEHILVTLRMTRARCVRVGQFIDNCETGMPREDRIEIPPLELRSAIPD